MHYSPRIWPERDPKARRPHFQDSLSPCHPQGACGGRPATVAASQCRLLVGCLVIDKGAFQKNTGLLELRTSSNFRLLILSFGLRTVTAASAVAWLPGEA